jgi:hypothetical protein
MMSKSKLQTALDEFVQAIVGIAEDTALDTLDTRAKALRTVRHTGRKPQAAKPAVAKAKKKSMTKPCPVAKCSNMGAPRHGMMCSNHKDLPKEEKNALRFRAKEPGGKWRVAAAPKKAVKRTKASGKRVEAKPKVAKSKKAAG